MINTVLTTNHLDNVFLKGNIHRKDHAITSFKDPTADKAVRIILLCLENAASGTNLIEASHVILMDTYTHLTREEMIAVEKQATGRAHRQGQKRKVTVVRFVIRNTKEGALYEEGRENGEEGWVKGGDI